jgi:hypothetical protein
VRLLEWRHSVARARGGAAAVQLAVREADAQLFRAIGIVGPWTRPVMGEVMAGGAAERAGLRRATVVLRVGSTAMWSTASSCAS